MIFSVGDKVRIRKDSEYYGNTRSNPADTEGVVVRVRPDTGGDHSVIVKWQRVGRNCYRPSDLEPVEEFEVGDKVRIRKDSQYYGEDIDWHPKDMVGIVIKVGLYLIFVEWLGGIRAWYRPQDLELTEELVYEI